METFFVIKILFLTTLSFLLAFSITPVVTHFLYKYKMGKRIRESRAAPIFAKLHGHKEGTPTMGGVLIWVTTLILALAFFYLAKYFDSFWQDFNFLTRSQTLLPLGALITSAIVGLADDYLDARGLGPDGRGFRMGQRLVLYTLIALVGAVWFYFKLDWDVIRVPFLGNFEIGLWYIPIFIFVIVATAFSVNEADGLDGLAGGILLTSFAAYGAIAFIQGRMELATFCGVIVGALLAFLWFNINPARFFMGDTGAMALGVTLGIIAMLTNYALLLPVICFLLVLESGSVLVQLISKKMWKKKIFRSTPIHHHFEAIGWSEPKIVMRFWVISGVTAVAGLILVLLDRGI
ncbi:phospho-N-acetylmuramoyl-pentapeptide-transferase [Candidatus Falkowbacteria bacterium]|nr:phospho-N-acetylmuramoyl-pentapeptide-transferase [Candidatus Falkowbacteria bacterium]